MAGMVVVVEDEDKIRRLVRGYLERDGMSVLTTASGAEAIDLVRCARPDAVVLDLGLPDVPGEEVLREIRAHAAVPVLVLTARAAEEERIRGLELGADDYVTKPFSPRELVLRVKALLRRGAPTPGPPEVESFGGGMLVVDAGLRQVHAHGDTVDLTPTEWGLLTALTRVPGRVYSRYELVNLVRGYEFEGYERTVDSHIKNLRRKLELDPGEPKIVETVVGAGYRLGLAKDG